jgi:hypothetical protein
VGGKPTRLHERVVDSWHHEAELQLSVSVTLGG